MEIDFNVYNYEYCKRDGNLNTEAKGVVKSEKHFPYFYENGKKIIFKPISKTKPLATPYFAYSEVIWSNILNYFFDSSIPIYKLANIKGYEKEVPKYYDYGTIVESITKNNEKIVNLYEYFMSNIDSNVNIKDYINYCLKNYDYTFFFKTKLFKENENIAREVAKQILYSILRMDQNFHYENVSFIYQDNNLFKVAPSIDNEFSTMFMYLDDKEEHDNLFRKYINLYEDKDFNNIDKTLLIIYKQLSENGIYPTKSKIIKNIEIISKLYPDIVIQFIEYLDNMLDYLTKNPIEIKDNNYITNFSSYSYEANILRYKENNIEQAKIKEKEINNIYISPTQVNNKINDEILLSAKVLRKKLIETI